MRILLVGRTRFRLPLDKTSRTKFEALARVCELRVLASAEAGASGDETFHLVRPSKPALLDGLLFHATLPVRVARELRDFEPDAVLVHDAHDAVGVLAGRRIARSDASVIVELHGDWRASARLYGSQLRRLIAPLVDFLAREGVRRADAVRTLSAFTTELARGEGVEPAAEFPAFVDFGVFRSSQPVPLPARPGLLFVGVLEAYKGLDVLARAWRLAAPRVPDAQLTITGRGTHPEIVEQLLVDLPRQTRWYPALDQVELVREFDAATALVLPSRSEGLPRVVLESFCRGRPVIATPSGGTVDLIRDGENGVLVPRENAEALADAMVDVLIERDWAETLAAGAAGSADGWLATPAEFAARVHDLVASLDT